MLFTKNLKKDPNKFSRESIFLPASRE